MEKNIKDYREKELKSYVIGNILIIFLGTGLLNDIIVPVNDVKNLGFLVSLINTTVLSAVIYIYVFLADAMVPSSIKDMVVWTFFGKPGETIFTDIQKGSKDKRFTTDSVEKKYSDIYEEIGNEKDPSEKKKIQNSKWYSIYKKHKKEAQVYISHRDSLLCRDSCIITFWLLCGYLIFINIYGAPISCKTVCFLLAEFVITWIIAQVKGKRFAYNVIATDVATVENEIINSTTKNETAFYVVVKHVE